MHITKGPKQVITVPCKYFAQWYAATVDKELSEFAIQQAEVEQIAWIPRHQLEQELKNSPQKYIKAMPEMVALFPVD